MNKYHKSEYGTKYCINTTQTKTIKITIKLEQAKHNSEKIQQRKNVECKNAVRTNAVRKNEDCSSQARRKTAERKTRRTQERIATQESAQHVQLYTPVFVQCKGLGSVVLRTHAM